MLANETHVKLKHGCVVAWGLTWITQVKHLARLLLNRAANLLNNVKLLRVYFSRILFRCWLLRLIIDPENTSDRFWEADLLAGWLRRVVGHGAAYLLYLRLQIYLCLSHKGGLIDLLYDINLSSRGLHLLTGLTLLDWVEIITCAIFRLLNRFFLLSFYQMLLYIILIDISSLLFNWLNP